MLKISIYLENAVEPIVYPRAIQLYHKGGHTCVRYVAEDGSEVTDKFPAAKIFRVRQQRA